MKLLVFGRNGQVATELGRLKPDALFLSREDADLSDPSACAAAIRAHAPQGVINAAAWTAVDKAEAEEAAATVINGDAPAAMARECADLGIPLVQISTDYVFDGNGESPFTPASPTSPMSAYGRSKLRGEQAVQQSGCTFAILRTSWVFSAHGNNFLKTMLRLGRERESLNVVADQIGGPTPANAIAKACLAIVEHLATDPGKSGIYHFSGAPDTSWAGFSREIMAQAGLDCVVTGIPSSEYPTPAKRPANSRLDCADLARFGLDRPDWKQAVQNILTELKVTR